jgi:hypothetical protein
MKKENILKAFIILFGVGVSYLKYNLLLFLDFEYLEYIIILTVVIFVVTIYFLNRKVYGLKTLIVNAKLKQVFSKLKSNKIYEKQFIIQNINKIYTEKINNNKFKEVKISSILRLLLWFLGALSTGIILGYHNKKPGAKLLRVALSKSSQWKKDLFLDWVRSRTTFFDLKDLYGNFVFNWFAFFVGFVSITVLYFIIKKTNLLSVLKAKTSPYLK